MHLEVYKIYYGDYKFVAEIDTDAELGASPITLWFSEKVQQQFQEGRFLREFYFEEANYDNIHTFCREFALYPDYRREVLTGQRRWAKRNALFTRNLHAVLGERGSLTDPGFERRAREFFRWLDMHAEGIVARPEYQQLQSLDSAFQPSATRLDPLIEPAVALLNQIPGVVTSLSCQGVSGKVRCGEYELLAVSPHGEYAYVSFESLSYFAHDSILAQLPAFPHITTTCIPRNFASHLLLRSTGNNQLFRAELMTLAQCILAGLPARPQDRRTRQPFLSSSHVICWQAALYPERQPATMDEGGILPSRLEWLCRPEQIERTLYLLYHLNYWARASSYLFYVDRQGLYTVKKALIQQAYTAKQLRPTTYVDGSTGFARDFSVEMAADIAAEFLLEHLASLCEPEQEGREAGAYDEAARNLFERIGGRPFTWRGDIEAITQAQAERYIRSALHALIMQARLTRRPIPHTELAALLVGPNDLLPLPHQRDQLMEYWHELDETNLRKLDPEGNSLIAFQYSSASASYIFHLPLRLAQGILPPEVVQQLQQRRGHSRELGVHRGRTISERESQAHPLQEILYELAVNIDNICPRKLTPKEDFYGSSARIHWEFANEDSEDECDDEWEEEKYLAPQRSKTKSSKQARRNWKRANRHLQPRCPLCQCFVAGDCAARLAHWQHTHPQQQNLTIGQVCWLLGCSEQDLKTAGLGLKPDHQERGNNPAQNGTRYWNLSTLETYAIAKALCL